MARVPARSTTREVWWRLHVERLVGDCRLKDTVTKVVIPASKCISLQQLVFFSSARAKCDPLDGPTLSQVCLGTTATQTLLPAVHFDSPPRARNELPFGRRGRGSQPSGDQTILQGIVSKRRLLAGLQRCACPLTRHREEAHELRPILDIFSNGSSDMMDYNLAMVFYKPAELPGDGSPSTEFGSDESFQNYLRIQTDALDITALDNAPEPTLRKLVAEVEKLLTKRSSTGNLDTGSWSLAPMGV